MLQICHNRIACTLARTNTAYQRWEFLPETACGSEERFDTVALDALISLLSPILEGWTIQFLELAVSIAACIESTSICV